MTDNRWIGFSQFALTFNLKGERPVTKQIEWSRITRFAGSLPKSAKFQNLLPPFNIAAPGTYVLTGDLDPFGPRCTGDYYLHRSRGTGSA